MRAAGYSRAGGAEVLSVRERGIPAVRPDEVLVRVYVSGVNPSDVKMRGFAEPEGFQVPGQDGAGIVEAVGVGVDGVTVGDRVWVRDAAWRRGDGTAQDHVALPERLVTPLPEGASFELGAALGVPALTAHVALTSAAGIPGPLAEGTLAGRAVLVAGGAGAVGHAAIELARWAGAHVIATVSDDRKGDLAVRAGADAVVNYRTTDAATAITAAAPGGVDIIVEVNLAANADLDAQIAARGAGISVYEIGAGSSAAISPVSMMKNLRYRFIMIYDVPAGEKEVAVAGVSDALAADALGVGEERGLPLTQFALEDIEGAHQAVERGGVGKVLLRLR